MEGVPFEAADAEYYRLPAISLHETTGFINRNVSPLVLVGFRRPYLRAHCAHPRLMPSPDIGRGCADRSTGTGAHLLGFEKVALRFSQPSLVLLCPSERITSAGPSQEET